MKIKNALISNLRLLFPSSSFILIQLPLNMHYNSYNSYFLSKKDLLTVSDSHHSVVLEPLILIFSTEIYTYPVKNDQRN